MKKVLKGLLLITAIVVSVVIYSETTYNPLKIKDFKKLFKGYNGNPDKICGKDFLGLSARGEFYDVYLYNVYGALIDKNFPNIVEWEDKIISQENIISKWRHCPLDSISNKLFEFTLNAKNTSDVKCFSSFNKEIINPNNYYCFIHVDELEQYFLLYCTDKQELYYIRRRGF